MNPTILVTVELDPAQADDLTYFKHQVRRAVQEVVPDAAVSVRAGQLMWFDDQRPVVEGGLMSDRPALCEFLEKLPAPQLVTRLYDAHLQATGGDRSAAANRVRAYIGFPPVGPKP